MDPGNKFPGNIFIFFSYLKPKLQTNVFSYRCLSIQVLPELVQGLAILDLAQQVLPLG